MKNRETLMETSIFTNIMDSLPGLPLLLKFKGKKALIGWSFQAIFPSV